MSDPSFMEVSFVCLGIAFVILTPIAIWSSNKHAERQEFLRSHECVVDSKEFTGNRVYCGKACTRPEVRTLYKCNDGPFVEVGG